MILKKGIIILLYNIYNPILIQKYMRFWLIPFSKEYKYISSKEEIISKRFNSKKGALYRFSRGYLRLCLSKVLGISSKDIPILSLPGQPPILPKKFGYISMSHSKDSLFLGWSLKRIGVDIENNSRNINLQRLLKSKWFKDEIKKISYIDENNLRLEILKIWVIKEALIKSHFGSIIEDYDKWIIDFDNLIAKHKKLEIYRYIVNDRIKDWTIGLAYEDSFEYKSGLVEIL
tara:strand:- start:622 stop:1314 length:693 start_codon:yes stop_codon:yes gene_type:complete